MITLLVIEKKALKAFKIPFKGIKKAKSYTKGFRTTEVRYLIYYIALEYGISSIAMEVRYGKNRTNVNYGEMVATNLLSYNKQYQAIYTSIKIELDNIIINENEN